MTQQPMSRSLAQQIDLRCVGRRGRYEDVRAGFSYDPSDPYAVWVSLPAGEVETRWAMCRSLLSRGLTDPVGEGDVQLWPSTDEAGRGIVVMDLWSHDLHMVAEIPTRELYRFLTKTLAAVPFGTEPDHLDLDGLITELLARSDS